MSVKTANRRPVTPVHIVGSDADQTPMPVQLSGSIVAEDSQTESDATEDVLTFSAPITAIEIFHSEETAQDFIINGLTVTVAAGGWRSPIGGTPSASVTLPNGVTGIVVTRLE